MELDPDVSCLQCTDWSLSPAPAELFHVFCNRERQSLRARAYLRSRNGGVRERRAATGRSNGTIGLLSLGNFRGRAQCNGKPTLIGDSRWDRTQPHLSSLQVR
jgi:hypothetical protein